MDMPVQVPVDNPNADTEWNDILRKHGVIPEKPPDPEPIIQEALIEAHQRAHENRLEDKDLDELAALEDEEDEAFLESYRQKRLAELNNLQKSSLYGQVYPLQKVDYSRDVTEASSKTFVSVLMTALPGSSHTVNLESNILSNHVQTLAQKYPDLKFCRIRADMCVEGYPEKNCPTLLIYRNGDIKRQLITLQQLRGTDTKFEDVERVLVEIGAIKEGDSRLRREHSDEDLHSSGRKLRQTAKKQNEDEDDDWD